MPEDALDHGRVFDEADDPHVARAFGAEQRIDFIDSLSKRTAHIGSTTAGHIVPDARFAELLTKAGEDVRLRAVLELGRHFGLRFTEASLLRPLKDRDGSILYIKRGTKGGRPRYVRITSARQREILDRIAGLVTSKDECLIPKDQKYIVWKQQTYDKLRELGLGREYEYTFHDLRRTFIHDEMDRLIEKGHTQEEAAKLVAKEVGHDRTEVLRWYGHW